MTTYNGWTNFETYCVGCWIDNDEPLYNEVKQMAQDSWDEGAGLSAYAKFTGEEKFTHEEKAANGLARGLQKKLEEMKPDLGNCVWTDLMDAALEEVNWRELAEHFLETVDRTEEVTEEVDEED